MKGEGLLKMRQMFRKMKEDIAPVGPAASARVVDGKLILSFPDAVKPVLWQMDLVSAKASALEVDQLSGEAGAGGQGGQAALILKTPKGEQTTIAVFESRDAALSALMTVGAALGCAQGRIRGAAQMSSGGGALPPWAAAAMAAQGGGSVSSSGGAGPSSFGGGDSAFSGAVQGAPQSAMRWVAGLAGVVLLVVLLNVLWGLSPKTPMSLPSADSQGVGAGASAAADGGAAGPDAVGVPLSADAVLGRP